MTTDDAFTTRLIGFGLNEKEAQTYLHLLKYGPKTPSPLAKSLHTYREDVHRTLTSLIDKGNMIIVAGEHGPAEVPDKGVFYQRLEKYARQHLDVESIEHRWSSKDVTTDDGLPIIGATSQKGIYMATGSDSGA
jgi:glycine/D-amino acid oxidase-like deaminating enzyme